jgi:hypothetical protein
MPDGGALQDLGAGGPFRPGPLQALFDLLDIGRARLALVMDGSPH